MQVRYARLLLFLTAVLTLPLPVLGPYGGLVPPVRQLILLGATAAVAVVEGGAGPIPGILALFALNAVVGLLLCAALAWLAARLLAVLAPAARRVAVLSICGLALLAALAADVYRTPFGRTPTANLWGVLQ